MGAHMSIAGVPDVMMLAIPYRTAVMRAQSAYEPDGPPDAKNTRSVMSFSISMNECSDVALT